MRAEGWRVRKDAPYVVAVIAAALTCALTSRVSTQSPAPAHQATIQQST